MVKKGDIVSVVWVDSVVESGWKPTIIAPDLEAKSAGYLIADLPDRYIIATSISPDGACALSPLHIPKGAVRTIEGL